MTNEDTKAACEALLRWLKSQGLTPEDAVPVLARTIALGIASIARDKADAARGAEIADEMVREMLGRWQGP